MIFGIWEQQYFSRFEHDVFASRRWQHQVRAVHCNILLLLAMASTGISDITHILLITANVFDSGFCSGTDTSQDLWSKDRTHPRAVSQSIAFNN
nr:hypothetical protein CFP56_70000 [Quercus suber]